MLSIRGRLVPGEHAERTSVGDYNSPLSEVLVRLKFDFNEIANAGHRVHVSDAFAIEERIAGGCFDNDCAGEGLRWGG